MKAYAKARYALVATAAALVLSACSTTSDISQKDRPQPRSGPNGETSIEPTSGDEVVDSPVEVQGKAEKKPQILEAGPKARESVATPAEKPGVAAVEGVPKGRVLGTRRRAAGIQAVLRGVGGLRSGSACKKSLAPRAYGFGSAACVRQQQFNTEAYDRIYENQFLTVVDKPLSTFSIDVDAASYSNVRRFLTRNSLPPKDAVRIEEMVNYFSYQYPQPTGDHPFSITTEMGPSPWNEEHRLVHIGLQGTKVATESLPPSNLVFLLDVSGSMNSPGKLPLLKMALKLLVKNLRAQDNIAMVVYAGAAGLVLPPTPGDRKSRIIAALDNLSAGGSTAGGAGIKLAYKVAKDNFLDDGNNRVILATDGDFNVGASSDAEMVRLIESKRDDGIFLTVLGFGTGNYKDAKMEKLADKGNGNYAYIDNPLEAKKVLVSEIGGTLLTIAKDVKIQVEFNPARVQAYRLIGYENRKLKDEDFNDDTKDAGELGAGHTVTALYEIVPAGVAVDLPDVDVLKYQDRTVRGEARHTREILTVKFRYKRPEANRSRLIVKALRDRISRDVSDNFRFSAAVAGFGMLLRDSEYKGALTYRSVLDMAKGAKGADQNGYRAELLKMIEKAELLASTQG